MQDAFSVLPAVGPVALVDLVRCPSHEARLAFPTLMRDVAGRVGGRVVWGSTIDQQIAGRGAERFEEVIISELPTGEACARALALRNEWQPETFVSELATFAGRPWPGWQRFAVRCAFAAWRLRGGAPEPTRDAAPAGLGEMPTGSANDPDAEQLAALLAAERDGRVVMLNFLRYRPANRAGEAAAPSGEAAYAAYGRAAVPLIARLGGRIRYRTRTLRPLAADADEPWNEFVAVEYPSRAHFIGMLADPRYQAAMPLREAGLESTWLLASTAHAAFH